MNISGTVYVDEGTTPDLSGPTVCACVNGAAATGLTVSSTADGTYTITGIVAAAGAVLTVYLQGNSQSAVTATISSGADLSGIDLYGDHLIVRHEQGTGISFANLHTAALNGDSGITAIYSSASNFALATAAGKTFYVWPGKKMSGSGNLILGGDFHNAGLGGPGIRFICAGTGGHTITSGGSKFASITVDCGTGTYILADALSLGSNVVLSSGTLDVGVENNSLTFAGLAWESSGGKFNPRGGKVTWCGTTGLEFVGSTTFYDLLLAPATPATEQVEFVAGTTQTILHQLQVQSSQVLSLYSAGSGPITVGAA